MAQAAQGDRLSKVGETALPLHDRRWQTVEKVLASSNFVRSERLRNFLIYVCSRSLSGQDDEITEQQIGVHVFGRPADYNPGDDNVVRTAARLLRQKLDLYSYEEGQDNAFRIIIPKGTYVPQFVDHRSSGPESNRKHCSSPRPMSIRNNRPWHTDDIGRSFLPLPSSLLAVSGLRGAGILQRPRKNVFGCPFSRAASRWCPAIVALS